MPPPSLPSTRPALSHSHHHLPPLPLALPPETARFTRAQSHKNVARRELNSSRLQLKVNRCIESTASPEKNIKLQVITVPHEDDSETSITSDYFLHPPSLLPLHGKKTWRVYSAQSTTDQKTERPIRRRTRPTRLRPTDRPEAILAFVMWSRRGEGESCSKNRRGKKEVVRRHDSATNRRMKKVSHSSTDCKRPPR